jgi:anti-sigma-K factor RskA
MNHHPFETLAAVYAVGALDGDDLVQFEAHLAEGCDRCRTTLRESHESLAGVGQTEPREIPPASVKEALLRRMDSTSARRPERRPERRRWLPWAAATAAAMVVSSMLTGGFVASRYEGRIGEMAREVSRIREEARRRDTAMVALVGEYRHALALLGKPATRVVALHGAGPGAEASGRVVWHEHSGGYLVVDKLPPLPPGKAYEAWTLGGPAPRPAGVFTVDASGQGRRKLDPTGDVQAKGFAVSIEPEGGVPAPTGPIVLATR